MSASMTETRGRAHPRMRDLTQIIVASSPGSGDCPPLAAAFTKHQPSERDSDGIKSAGLIDEEQLLVARCRQRTSASLLAK